MQAEQKKYNPARLLILPALIGIMGILWLAGLKDYLSLKSIQSVAGYFKSTVQANFIIGAAIYMACYIALVVSCLPAVALATLLGGYLFGIAWGTFLVLLSATSGATFLFLIARSSLGGFLRDKAGLFYARAETRMRENAVSYMLFMRLIPGMPFSIANIVPALFNVPLRLFVLTTMIGIIPSTIILVNMGQALGQVKTLSDLFTLPVLSALGLMALMALAPILIRKKRTISPP